MTNFGPNLLYRNRGDGTFENVAARAGIEAPGWNTGAAFLDADGDGDLDLYVANDSTAGSSLTVVLEVPPGRGTAIGTRVRVTAGKRQWVLEEASSESYLSVHDPRLHVGLGSAEVADRVEVLWPDSSRTVLENVPARQFLRVRKES